MSRESCCAVHALFHGTLSPLFKALEEPQQPFAWRELESRILCQCLQLLLQTPPNTLNAFAFSVLLARYHARRRSA